MTLPPAPLTTDRALPVVDLVYVGFWKRVIASLVDSVLLMLLIAPIGYFVFDTNAFDFAESDSDPTHFLISTILPALVVVVFWIQRQATPGKMMFGARIVDAKTGADPGTGQLLLRYAGYYVSAIVFGLGFIWVAFDARKQGWHDKIAGTVVVRDRSPVDPLGIDR
ncbi:MAG: RDD family protein [Burkholderiaceae bacterium]